MKNRRIISIFLTIVMAFSVQVTCSFAVNENGRELLVVNSTATEVGVIL